MFISNSPKQTKMLAKLDSARLIYKKLQVILIIHKLLGYIFGWNCLDFSHKMGLSIRM